MGGVTHPKTSRLAPSLHTGLCQFLPRPKPCTVLFPLPLTPSPTASWLTPHPRKALPGDTLSSPLGPLLHPAVKCVTLVTMEVLLTFICDRLFTTV